MPSLCSPACSCLFTADGLRSSDGPGATCVKCPVQLWGLKQQILGEPFYHLEPTSPASLPHPLLLLTSPGTNQPSTWRCYSSTTIVIWAAFSLNSTSEPHFRLCLTTTGRDWFYKASVAGGLPHGGKSIWRPRKELWRRPGLADPSWFPGTLEPSPGRLSPQEAGQERGLAVPSDPQPPWNSWPRSKLVCCVLALLECKLHACGNVV